MGLENRTFIIELHWRLAEIVIKDERRPSQRHADEAARGVKMLALRSMMGQRERADTVRCSQLGHYHGDGSSLGPASRSEPWQRTQLVYLAADPP